MSKNYSDRNVLTYPFGHGLDLPELKDILGKLRKPDRLALEDFYGQINEAPGVISVKLKSPTVIGGKVPKVYWGLEIAVQVSPGFGIRGDEEESLLKDYCQVSKKYHFGEKMN
jgi:hypothetical protein